MYKTNYCYDPHGVLPDRFDDHDVRGNLRLVTRRNLLAMLISVELDPQFGRYQFRGIQPFRQQLRAFFFALFAIGISAAETAVAIAIIINIYRNLRHIQVKDLKKLKW
ncbi:MAG: NADH-quinone oxidoreductase subunit K [Alistipes putredinis]